MKIVKVKIINAHFADDECVETLHDFCGVNDGDVIDAVWHTDCVFLSNTDGHETYLRKCEYEVVE